MTDLNNFVRCSACEGKLYTRQVIDPIQKMTQVLKCPKCNGTGYLINPNHESMRHFGDAVQNNPIKTDVKIEFGQVKEQPDLLKDAVCPTDIKSKPKRYVFTKKAEKPAVVANGVAF